MAANRVPAGLLRERRFKRYSNRDGAPAWLRAWEHTKLAVRRGNVYSAVRNIAGMASSGAAALAAGHPNPQVREAAFQVAVASAGVATAAEIARIKARTNYRADSTNLRNIARIYESEDRNRLRILDREVVRLYSRIPEHVERNLGGTTESAADHFRSVRGLKIAPDKVYKISQENPEYAELVMPLFQYMVHRLPNGQDRMDLLYKHFPGRKLEPITHLSSLKMPRDLQMLVPPRILDAHPTTVNEAVGLALLGASVARAREKGFKD